MKKQLLPILLTGLMSMVGAKAFAQDIRVVNADGMTIYYNYINDGKELEFATNGLSRTYSGSVVIPEEVTYLNRTRKVTSIGEDAFHNCDNLTSVTIPNSVTSIGIGAFSNCSSLTSITIPNSVTSIGNGAFSNCSSLSSITIPNSVTSIGTGAFNECSGLTTITIGNSVTYIGTRAFYGCTGLTSVHISDLESWCKIFFDSYNSNPLYKAHHLYLNGEEVKELQIPNSINIINQYAFHGCTGLTSITIPNSVTSIENGAFEGCKNVLSVISQIEEPFEIGGKSSGKSFDLDNFNNATLYVPVGTIEKYKATEGWKDFLFIEEGTGPNGGSTPETMKCATPTIDYQYGKLTFTSETEGASYQYTISDDDIKSGNSNEVQLGVTYHISVYATKAGYENSNVATATLCWIDIEPKMEGITNGVANVRAMAVLIQNSGNILTVSGADVGTAISVFDMAGRPAGSAKALSEETNIITSLRSGDIGIVKIGDKAVKVLMK